MTQVCFSGHGASVLAACAVDGAMASSLTLLSSPDGTTFSSLSLGFFSFLSPGVPDDSRVFPKSNAVPGVFGVLLADPKEAKAPEPRPKADEPVEFGDWIPDVLRGAMALKGLFRPP